MQNSEYIEYIEYRGWEYEIFTRDEYHNWTLRNSDEVYGDYDTYEYAESAARDYIDNLIIEQSQDWDDISF